jgi:hypothetical protein
MTVRYYSSIAADTTLSGAVTAGQTTITVTSTTGWPLSYPFTLAIDYGSSTEELVDVTSVTGLNATVTRGVDSSTASGHAIGAVVRHVIIARDIREANTHVNASSAVHGLTGSVVGTTDTQVITNKDLSSGTNTFPSGLVTGSSTTVFTNKDISSSTNTFPAGLPLSENPQVGTTYTTVLGDAHKIVTLSNAAAITASIPTNASVAYPVGTLIHFEWEGVGQPTITAVTPGTTTILSNAATAASPKLRARYSACTAWKEGTDTWRIWGDIV